MSKKSALVGATLEEAQEVIGTWHRARYGVDRPLGDLALKLSEECGEVAAEVLHPGRRRKDPEALANELADVLVVLLATADRADIDLAGALRRKFAKVLEKRPAP